MGHLLPNGSSSVTELPFIQLTYTVGVGSNNMLAAKSTGLPVVNSTEAMIMQSFSSSYNNWMFWLFTESTGTSCVSVYVRKIESQMFF